jgi:DNA-binding NtrC family response regulator
MVKTLVDILQYKGYEVQGESSSRNALELIKQNPYDCVLTDIKMPELNGLEFFREIKKLRPRISVVFMTAYATDDIVRQATEEGAIATLNKPLDINLLLCFFSALGEVPSIVIVDDDPQFCETLGAVLQIRGYSVIEVSDPDLLEGVLESEGQVVLLDMKLRDVSGLEVLKQIRKWHPFIPVVLITGYRNDMAAAIESALEIKAYTCLYKPLQIEELLQTLSTVHHQQAGRLLQESPLKMR